MVERNLNKNKDWYILKEQRRLSRCIRCKNFTGDIHKRDKAICVAFENGIPQKYIERKEDDERECNKGIKYEYKPYSDPRFHESPKVVIIRCGHCKNFIEYNDEKEKVICKAFKNGIPDEYLKREENDKRECNNGLHYEHK